MCNNCGIAVHVVWEYSSSHLVIRHQGLVNGKGCLVIVGL